MLEENVKQVNQQINQALLASPSKQAVTLVAVTKTVTSQEAAKLLPLGITNFGENRVEKMLEKQEALKEHDEIIWHLIGTLQTRKVKEIINKIDYFHALDRIKTASEIQKRANKVIKCFVQVNVSEETTKQGILLSETKDFIIALKRFTNIQIVGLMTMAPHDATPERKKNYFEQLAKKQVEIANLNLENAPCTELSMGMSNDYVLAVEAGASFVRVGSSLFENNCEERI